MAGTDHRRRAVTGGPAIILVEPQLGENIGTAARAMMNCALDDLRLVRPRDGWPSERAVAAASGADAVLDKARLYPDLPAAIADLRPCLCRDRARPLHGQARGDAAPGGGGDARPSRPPARRAAYCSGRSAPASSTRT